MAFNFNSTARAVREMTLPFKLGIGGPEKVRELKALRALNETPYMLAPEDHKWLSDLGHTEVAKDGVRFSPRGRQRLAELEDLVKSVIPQGNPAPTRTAPPVGALSGLPDPNDPLAWQRKT